MAGTFNFAPNGTVPIIIPPDPPSGMSLNGWFFSSKPVVPYQKKFKLTLHGMKWILQSSGLFDTTTTPTINARVLEQFYESNQLWDTFTWVHPHIGSLTCRFAEPVQIPAGEENAGGNIAPFDVTLIHHNPGYP